MAGLIPTVGLHRRRTRFGSSTTNDCSSTIDSHCQIQQRPKLLQSQASLQTPAWAFLPLAPPSCAWPLSVSDIFCSLSPCNSAPPKDLSNAGAGFTYLQPKQFASKTSLEDFSITLEHCSPSVCATKWDGQRNPRNLGQTQPRALLISVSQSSPKDSLKTAIFLKNLK